MDAADTTQKYKEFLALLIDIKDLQEAIRLDNMRLNYKKEKVKAFLSKDEIKGQFDKSAWNQAITDSAPQCFNLFVTDFIFNILGT